MSFRLKTILGVALIEVSLLLLLVWHSIDYLTRGSHDELMVRGKTTAEMFARLTKDAVIATDLATLKDALEELQRSQDVVYTRITDGDRVLAQIGDPDLLKKDYHADDHYDEISDGIYDVSAVIHEGGYDYGRIEIGFSTERVDALISGARSHLAGIALLELALVGLFSYILGSYLTRGLQSLKVAAQSIRDGDLGIDVPIRGEDELAATAKAFNLMSRRLADSHQSMRASMDASKALSEKLAEREVYLRAILDTAVDGYTTIDEQGWILDINEAGARIFGYRSDELVACRIGELLVSSAAGNASADSDWRDLIDADRQTSNVHREVAGRRKGDARFPLEISLSEMRLDARRLFVVLLRDLSDHKRIENEARRSDAVRRAVLNASLDALVTMGLDGNIIDFNPAAERIFGYSHEQACGQPMSELLIPPTMRAHHEAGMARYIETGAASVIGRMVEVEAMRSSGETFPAELTVMPITLENEVLFTAFVRDISERRRTEAELQNAKLNAEAASAAKSRFLAHMSHEIRSPLNAVLGSVGLLLEDGGLGEEQQLYARTAQSAGKTLLGLINDVLDFSRIEAGELTLESAPFESGELVREAIDVAAFRAREKGLLLAVQMESGAAGQFMGDASRLRQVLVNLLDNAVKYTIDGMVLLSVMAAPIEDDEMRLSFRVEDTGIGIPAAAQASLFEEFTQVDDSDSTRYGGTGLGLAICHRLVTRMGGKIGLESKEGGGSCFWVDIPLRTPQHAVVTAQHAGGDKRILTVGLHPMIERGLRMQCQDAGTEIECVDTVGDAERATGTYHRIVLSDCIPDIEAGRMAEWLESKRLQDKFLVTPKPDAVPAAIRSSCDRVIGSPLYLQDLLAEKPARNECRPSTPAASDNSAQSQSGAGGGYLLLAEDSPANQVVATAMLRRLGYRVDVVENGKDAVQAFTDGAYDLILMDLRMPEMNGLEATARIRALERGQQIPIVALTANTLQEDIERCLASGMDDYVTKPVRRDHLCAALDRWLKAGSEGTQTEGADCTDEPDSRCVATAETAPRVEVLDETAIQTLAEETSPEAVPGMMKLFFQELDERIDRINCGLTTLPIEDLRTEAHTIKSSAGTFGARAIQEVAYEMEVACREQQRAVAEGLGKQLSGLFDQTLHAYQIRYGRLEEEC